MVYREAERIRSAGNTFSQDAFSRLPQPQTVCDWGKVVLGHYDCKTHQVRR